MTCSRLILAARKAGPCLALPAARPALGGTLKRSLAQLEGGPRVQAPVHPQARTLEGATRRVLRDHSLEHRAISGNRSWLSSAVHWPGAPLALAVALIASSAHAADPNDTWFAASWHHAQIGSQAAWAISTGSPGIIVAVVDTGVDATHPDLAGRVVQGWNLLDNSPDTTPFSWHGTSVAGVIAAVRNNGRGVAGLTDVSIMPVVVSQGETISAAQAVEGIYWAVDHGAKVVNISASVLHLDILQQAAQYAWNHGALVVMSTANSDSGGVQPAWDEIILVSSSDRNDERYMSEAALGLDLLAPGVDIYTTVSYPDALGQDTYGIAWGTSFAAPMVSAAAALAWSINPDLTPAQVSGILFSTAVDLQTPGWDYFTGYGRLDLAGVAEAAYATTPEPATAALLLAGAAATVLHSRRRRRA